MSAPWLKFYPSDWRADPALRMCSIGARGLWMEMLCVMHEAEPRGSLLINGRPLSHRQVASLAGGAIDEVEGYLQELEDAGVYSRADNGTIFSRRMQRDAEKEASDKANGGKGGNPALRKEKQGVNPPPNGEDKAQKPEARDQTSVAGATDAPRERKHAWPDDFCDQVWAIFPKHVEKKAGMDALKAVHRADKLDWQTLSNAITSLAATCDPQFVPALHRWLKGERWTDQRPLAKPGAGPPQRRTFGQLAAESAAEAAGYPNDQHSDHQADDHRGPTLDLEPDRSGADLVDLQSHRAGRGGW